MLAPRTPAGTLFSRWAHVAPSPDALDGQVQAVTLDGLPMPPSGVSLDPAGMLAAALAAGLGVLPAAAGFPLVGMGGRAPLNRRWLGPPPARGLS